MTAGDVDELERRVARLERLVEALDAMARPSALAVRIELSARLDDVERAIKRLVSVLEART